MDREVKIQQRTTDILKSSREANFEEMLEVLTRLESKKMIEWDIDDVCYWISSLEQENKLHRKKNFKLFRKNKVDGKKLLEFTSKELKELGMEEKDIECLILER